jgi:hypothetical protein
MTSSLPILDANGQENKLKSVQVEPYPMDN